MSNRLQVATESFHNLAMFNSSVSSHFVSRHDKKSMSAIAVIVNVPRETVSQLASQFDGQNSARKAETLIG